MGNFLSGQFRKSLPSCVESLEKYCESVKLVAQDIEVLYSKMTECMGKVTSCTKENLVELVKVFLCTRMGEGKNPSFLASQIVYNLDEMIDMIPSKKWRKIVMGFGSREAMSWMKERETKTNIEALKDIHKNVQKLDQEMLQCLGLEKKKEFQKSDLEN